MSNNRSILFSWIIRASYFVLLTVVPLIFLPWNYELFEFNKMMVTYAVTAVVACAWVAKWFAEKKISIVKTPLDFPIALFFVSQLLSSLFSIDRHISWFGYYSRFNGGMWSLICYTILYYAFVSNFLEQTPPPQNPKSQIPNSKQIQRSNFQNKGNTSTIEQYSNRTIYNLLYTTLVVAFLISLYGIAESFGIDKHLWVQDVQNRVFSTLGQPNWLAAYLVALLPISMWFALRSLLQNSNRTVISWGQLLSPGFIIWTFVSVIFFWTLLLTRSRSGYFGLAAADIFLVSFIVWKLLGTKHAYTCILWAITLNSLFAIIVLFNGTKIDRLDAWITLKGLQQKMGIAQRNNVSIQQAIPIPPTLETKLLDVGISESTDIRSHVWKAAIDAWKSNVKTMLVGIGTETFAFAFYQFRPKEHNMTSEWDFLYNKAHNEYLNFLATTGILGIGSYIFFLLTFFVWFYHKILYLRFVEIIFILIFGLWVYFAVKIFVFIWNQYITHTDKLTQQESIKSMQIDINYTILYALYAGWFSILVTNFFGFSVVIMQVFLFLYPAITFVLVPQTNNIKLTVWSINLPFSAKVTKAGPIAMTLVSLALIINLIIGWWADLVFARGYRANRVEDFVQSEQLLSLAVTLRGGESFYHDELATALTGKAILALGAKNEAEASQLAKKAISASDKAVRASPNNVNFWKTRTKMFYSFSSYDPQLISAAVSALETGHKLSPNDAKIMYNLAVIYGRAGDGNRAIEILKKAIEVKPDYRDLYYGLYVFYTEAGKNEEAGAIINDYLTRVDPADKEFKEYREQLRAK